MIDPAILLGSLTAAILLYLLNRKPLPPVDPHITFGCPKCQKLVTIKFADIGIKVQLVNDMFQMITAYPCHYCEHIEFIVVETPAEIINNPNKE